MAQAAGHDDGRRGVGRRGPLVDPPERPRVPVGPQRELQPVVGVLEEHLVDPPGQVLNGAGRSVGALRRPEERRVGVGPLAGEERVQHVGPVGVLSVPVVVEGAGGEPGITGQVVDAEVAEGLAEGLL